MRRIRGAGGMMVALAVLCFAGASAAGQMLNSEQLARHLGMEHKRLVGAGGAATGCKLWNEGHDVVLLVGLSTASIDGRLVSLSGPVEATGGGVVVPAPLLDALKSRFGVTVEGGSGVLAARSVVIDPGHGGRDPGAVGSNGLTEKEVNLEVSRIVARVLSEQGVEVTMTRTTDRFVDLTDRAEIANRTGCDLFVSIHANALDDPSVHGHLVLVPADEWEHRSQGNVIDRALEAARHPGLVTKGLDRQSLTPATKATLMGVLLEEYRRRSYLAAQEITRSLSGKMHTLNRGSVQDWRGLRVLVKTYCPAVLVEMDFLSNPSVEKSLNSSEYQERLGRAIAQGILSFLTKHHGAGE